MTRVQQVPMSTARVQQVPMSTARVQQVPMSMERATMVLTPAMPVLLTPKERSKTA